MIRLACPSCQMKVGAPDSLAGRVALCPGCGAVVSVPAATPPALPPLLPGTLPSEPAAGRSSPPPLPPTPRQAEEPMDVLAADEEPMDVLPGDERRRRPPRPRRRPRYDPEPEERWRGRRPGFWSRNRFWGCVGVAWGGLIVLYCLVSFAGHHKMSGAYAAGQTAALLFGVVMLLAGAFYLWQG